MLISVLDLLSLGYDVHVLADGVSSSNKEEIPFALDRMRQAGACIGTSESVAFQMQCMSSRCYLDVCRSLTFGGRSGLREAQFQDLCEDHQGGEGDYARGAADYAPIEDYAVISARTLSGGTSIILGWSALAYTYAFP